MNKKSKESLTPFPSIGEFLREVALALGTKNSNKQFDDFANQRTVNASLRESLIHEHIYEPVVKFTDPDFATSFQELIDDKLSDYIELIRQTDVSFLHRDEVLPILVKDYFIPKVIEAVTELRDKFDLPELDLLFTTDKPLFAAIIESVSETGIDVLLRTVYSDSTGSIKSTRDTRRREISGEQLFTSTSLTLFAKEVSDTFPKIDKVKLARLLVVTRALTWRNSEDFSFITWIKEFKHKNELALPPSKSLNIFCEKKRQANAQVNLLWSACMATLSPNTPKNIDDRRKIESHLDQLAKSISLNSLGFNVSYQIAWARAKFFLLLNEYEAALYHYEEAVDGAIYRAGAQQEKLLLEALYLAGHLKDRSKVKKFKQLGILLNLIAKPAIADAKVIDDWEFYDLSLQFSRHFPSAGRFSGPDKELENEYHLPFLAYDEDDIKSKDVDLKSPDREFTLIAQDGQKRKYPQLRFFAGWGNTKAVSQLLNAGANVDAIDNSGASPLLAAIQFAKGTKERYCLDLILERPHSQRTLDSATVRKQLTPLFCAIEFGEPDVVATLIKRGATPDRRGNLTNMTPLYKCIGDLNLVVHFERARHYSIAKSQENLDIQMQDALRRYSPGTEIPENLWRKLSTFEEGMSYEKTLMLFDVLWRHHAPKASATNLLKIIEILLENGANPNALHHYPIRRYTPMMLAAETDSVELFELMLRFEGNPYLKNEHDRNALDIAKGFKSFEALEYFLFNLQ